MTASWLWFPSLAGAAVLAWLFKKAFAVDADAPRPWTLADERRADRELEKARREWAKGLDPDAVLLQSIDDGTYRVPPEKARQVLASIFTDEAQLPESKCGQRAKVQS